MIAVLLGGIALVVLGGVLALFVSLTVGATALAALVIRSGRRLTGHVSGADGGEDRGEESAGDRELVFDEPELHP